MVLIPAFPKAHFFVNAIWGREHHKSLFVANVLILVHNRKSYVSYSGRSFVFYLCRLPRQLGKGHADDTFFHAFRIGFSASARVSR